MLNALITSLQIFGIGFSFGIAGPCFLLCTPILVTYVAGTKKRWVEGLADAAVFSLGRFLAYVILGALAGLSGSLLKQFTGSEIAAYFKPLAGAVSIILGIIILIYRDRQKCLHPPFYNKVYNIGGLFAFGFMVGVSPCAPLLGLLLQITLMSKNAFEGASYAAFFGLGTFVSGLIAVGALSGVLAEFFKKVIKSDRANLIFRIICASLLVLLGLGLILTKTDPRGLFSGRIVQ